MNYLMLWRRLKLFLVRIVCRPRPKISLLIPFSSKEPNRKRNLRWLLHYWKHELPEAEIIVGHSRGDVFCKGEALNDAAKKAKGRVLVIMDADAYIYGSVIERCADRILEELDNHLWYVPYRALYRLTEETTEEIIESDPSNPFRLPSPPPPGSFDNRGLNINYGHRYGAMCMMFPREALEVVEGFDERFRGWGGEDVSFLRALDTLWGKHKTTKNDILHLWHPFVGDNYKTRKWENQEKGDINHKITTKYNKATNHPSKMRKLIEEKNKKEEK